MFRPFFGAVSAFGGVQPVDEGIIEYVFEFVQECLTRGKREEESADRLDQLAAKVDAFVAIPSETSA